MERKTVALPVRVNRPLRSLLPFGTNNFVPHSINIFYIQYILLDYYLRPKIFKNYKLHSGFFFAVISNVFVSLFPPGGEQHGGVLSVHGETKRSA